MIKTGYALLLLCALLAISGRGVYAQTTEFAYQGFLKDGVNAANGSYDFDFALYDAPMGGGQLGPTLTRNAIAVSGGVFSVKLDFSDQFPGAGRYLEIRVRPTGQPGITILSPRQILTSTPYAIRSLSSGNANSLGGVPAAQYVTTTTGGTSFIQNSLSSQPAANFNIDGTGTAAIFDSGGHYRLGGNRIIAMTPDAGLVVGWGTGAANTTGVQNSFFGSFAGLANTTGSYNSFFGRSSGQDNTTGFDNSYFGQISGLRTTTGNSNSFFGSNSGQLNTTGSENVFIGQSSGLSNTIGNLNSFFGRNSGRVNTTGVQNTFIGAYSGNLNTSGARNVFIGSNTAPTNTTGNNNTLIGDGSDVSSSNLNFATAIGSGALSSSSDTVIIGKRAGTYNGTPRPADTVLIPGKLSVGLVTPANFFHIAAGGGNIIMGDPGCASGFSGIGFGFSLSGCDDYSFAGNGFDTIISRPAGGYIDFRSGNISQIRISSTGLLTVSNLGNAGTTALCINGASQLSGCSSSLRYKENIASFGNGLDLIKRLSPITFDWKDGGIRDLGLAAEEVAAIEPLLATYNRDGQVEGVKYDRIGVVLVNAVKEQQAKIESLERQLAKQRDELEALKTLVCSQNAAAATCDAR